MCLTSDAVYRIRDADAIFRIERKDDQKIAQNSKLFYKKYFEFATNHSGSVRGTLWRIVLKYILFLRMVQSFYRRYLQNTTNNVTGAQEDHDRSRYAAYSVKRVYVTKFLGVHIDSHLNWGEHINHIKSKISKNVSIMRRVKRYFID